jgi:aminomethyltransferase
MANRTPLYDCHVKAGAKMVDFHGWDMPVNYGSQIEEHYAVRKAAGVFDVSHMTVVDIKGTDAKKYLLHLVPNNAYKLTESGKGLYSAMLNENGGIVDDLIFFYIKEGDYRMVVNSATHDKDLAWLQKQAKPYKVTLTERADLAMIAVQGPLAREIAAKAMTPDVAAKAMTLKTFYGMHIGNWFISRTGYTGEDGFEIMLPASEAPAFWDKLLAVGIKPCGLGARDTLRLECGLNLYGDDMDDTVTPLESNITWTVAWEPASRDFTGRAVLEKQRVDGVKRLLVGLVLKDRGIPRNHDKVFVDGKEIGVVTSGSFSPTLQKGIAFARVASTIGKTCEIECRGKCMSAIVIQLPFIRKGKQNF